MYSRFQKTQTNSPKLPNNLTTLAGVHKPHTKQQTFDNNLKLFSKLSSNAKSAKIPTHQQDFKCNFKLLTKPRLLTKHPIQTKAIDLHGSSLFSRRRGYVPKLTSIWSQRPSYLDPLCKQTTVKVNDGSLSQTLENITFREDQEDNSCSTIYMALNIKSQLTSSDLDNLSPIPWSQSKKRLVFGVLYITLTTTLFAL